VAELRQYIDWTPFFGAWEMRGRFPDLLNNPASGEAARSLYNDAQAMLDRIEAEGWLSPRGVFGLWPGHSTGDDVVIYCERGRQTEGLIRHRCGPRSTTCANKGNIATAYRTGASRTSSRRLVALSTTSAASP
jgi:cobalamin-dependent methionine synthase I